jgi:hypothetical protein
VVAVRRSKVRRISGAGLVVAGLACGGLLLSNATATPKARSQRIQARQAIEITSNARTARDHEIVDLGFANASSQPATLLISLKNHVPLARGQVLLNAPGETFRNGTITDPIPANHHRPFYDLELTLPRGSTGSVEVGLKGDFGPQGPLSSQVASIGFGP